MRPPRYLALLRLRPKVPVRRRPRVLAKTDPSFSILLDDDDAFVMSSAADAAAVLGEREGVVLGSVYERGSSVARRETPESEQRAILASRGERLIRINWGSYIAILIDRTRGVADIVRSPFGELPCYFTVLGGTLAIASDLAMLRKVGWSASGVAWRELTQHLLTTDLVTGNTCLQGVGEIRGGDRIHVEGGVGPPEHLWSPWDYAAPNESSTGGVEAARRVRDAADIAVRSRTSDLSHPLLLLSGGLDSSIVGACLIRAERPFSALNLVSRDPSGDERRYARAVADYLGIALTEAVRDVAEVDLDKSQAAHLPWPSSRAFTQASRLAAETAAAEVGADAIIDGGGGDNVFCSLQSAAPVADTYLAGSRISEVLRTAASVGDLAQASVPQVLAHAVRRIWFPRSYRWAVDTSLLNRSVTDELCVSCSHPWLENSSDRMPGKTGQIGLLAAAQSWAERLDPQARLQTRSPLVSQPLIETCLRIPSWLWFEDGRNRALARRAFAGRLPSGIVERRSKASPDSFVAELFEYNRERIKAMLLDGELARRRIIDRQAVEQAFKDPRPAHGGAYRRLMRLVDAEAWVGAWS